MKIRRSARIGLLVATVATVATIAPPGSAEGLGVMVFQGTASVTTGLGFPVLTGGTPGVVIDPTPGKKGLVTVTGGNTRSASFASHTCLGGKVMVTKDKPNLVPGVPVAVNGPLCTIGATLVVSGFCGLSSGVGTGTATATTPAVPYTAPLIPHNTISFNITWSGLGIPGIWIILGNWWFGTGPKPATPEGDLMAVANATPDPSLSTPTTSCTNKTQQRFAIAGVAAFLHPKVLPS